MRQGQTSQDESLLSDLVTAERNKTQDLYRILMKAKISNELLKTISTALAQKFRSPFWLPGDQCV